MTEPMPQTFYCANHPKRETMLRCNRCNKPICMECAVLTPTGYRCKECVRQQKKVYETSVLFDYPLGFVIAAAIAFGGSEVARFLGFFTLFIAPIVGVIIAEVVRWAVKKRRSIMLTRLVAVGTALGALPILLIQLLGFLQYFSAGGAGSLMYLVTLIWPAVYAFLVTTTVVYRLSGIKL
jgi:hypothetical protein